MDYTTSPADMAYALEAGVSAAVDTVRELVDIEAARWIVDRHDGTREPWTRGDNAESFDLAYSVMRLVRALGL